MLILASYCKERRYREDAINVIGLPVGAQIRWRYSIKHVEEALLSAPHCCPKNVILAFISSKNPTPSLIPVRHGKLLRVVKHGSIAEFVIKLEGHPHKSLVEASSDEEPHKWYKNSIKKINSRKVAFSSPKISTPKSKTDPITQWERVVGEIFFHEIFDGEVNFLYFMRQEKSCLSFFRSFSWNGGLLFESNTKATFRVHYKVSETKKSKNMKPIGEIVLSESGAALDFVTSRRVRIDAPQDSKLIELQVGSGYRISKGHLAVTTVGFTYPDDNQERKEEAFTRHDIPVSTGIASPFIASLASAFAVGLAAIGIPEGIETIETAGLLLFTLLGAIGLYHGFK